MKPPRFRYLRAESVDGALRALADNPDARPLAGGQSLIAMMNLRLVRPACLVDINRVAGLDYVREDGDGVAIGTLARHNDVKHSDLVRARCPLLTEAYESIAHHTVRNRGTLGGNLCHADPSSETPAVMVAVGATLVLQSVGGRREVAAEEFFHGPYETAARQDELLVEIRLPGRGTDGWAFAEVSNRHGDFAIAVVATTLRLADGRCEAARVVASAVGEHAARLTPAEDALTGGAIDDAAIERAAEAAAGAIDPHSDSHADAAYRRDAVAALTRRTLRRGGRALRLREGAMERETISVTVNGRAYEREIEPRRLLSDFLRDDLRLTGTHVGCEHGVCGACTVMMDGVTARSCLTFAVMVDGAEIETIEGLGSVDAMHPVQQAFWEKHGLQCGFCTPGMLMTAVELLERTPDPSVDDIRDAISGNLCRCTGYQTIVDSIRHAARLMREDGA